MTFANFGHPASANIRRNGNESTLRRFLTTQKEKKKGLSRHKMTKGHSQHIHKIKYFCAHSTHMFHSTHILCSQHTHFSHCCTHHFTPHLTFSRHTQHTAARAPSPHCKQNQVLVTHTLRRFLWHWINHTTDNHYKLFIHEQYTLTRPLMKV